MPNNFFNVLREGTHTTFQDYGFENVQHLGISNGGIVDKNLFELSNLLLNNHKDNPVIEFASQGPLLKLMKGNCRFTITGNVSFNIITNNETTKGICNQTYNINQGDSIDILSTINSNYGYFSVEGGFDLNINKFKNYSTLTTSKIGMNEGYSLQKNSKIFFSKNGSLKKSYLNINPQNNDNIIRVIKGPQMNFFMIKILNKFFNKPFTISNSTNRIGIRLRGNIIKSIKSHDISSEGVIKGSIQVPGDGNPIVLLNDHPTIGGYPKIATVILSDIAKIAQLPIGSSFYFKEISIKEAENIYFKKLIDSKKIINK